jgi:5-formyltetrahydrofolate cyclo-ligase
MDEKLIERINALAKKSKEEGLTEEEKIEQQKLRREYINIIKKNLRAELNNISIVEKDGSITDLGKKFGGVKNE